jgi:hypothetical protein
MKESESINANVTDVVNTVKEEDISSFFEAFLLTIAEHSMWPLTILMVFILLVIFFRESIKNVINSLTELKVGDFSLSIKQAATKTGTLPLLDGMSNLNSQQLHLFLVLGGEGGSSCTYQNKWPSDQFDRAMKHLSDLGLIEFSKGYSKEHGEEVTKFGNTEKGISLHKIIMDQIYKDLVISPK